MYHLIGIVVFCLSTACNKNVDRVSKLQYYSFVLFWKNKSKISSGLLLPTKTLVGSLNKTINTV